MRPQRQGDVWMLLGLVAIGIGVLIATSRLLPHGWRFDHFGAPIILMGGGLAILVSRRDRYDSDPTDDPEPPAPGGEATGEETTTQETTTQETPTQETPADAATNDEMPTEVHGLTPPIPPVPPVPPSAWTQTAPWPTAPSRRARRYAARRDWRERRPRSFLTPVTLSILLIGAGIASLLQATGALDVNVTVALAIATCVVGAALVVAAFAGRAHTLILVGVVLLTATAVSGTIDVPLRGGIGSDTYRPLDLASLKSHYELGIGELQLDLRDLPLTDRTTVVDAQTGIGELLVLVPSSVRVEVTGHAGAGSVMLFGRDDRRLAGERPARDRRDRPGRAEAQPARGRRPGARPPIRAGRRRDDLRERQRGSERMMQRHPTDFVELFFGLAFLATGGGFIVRRSPTGPSTPRGSRRSCWSRSGARSSRRRSCTNREPSGPSRSRRRTTTEP